MKKIALIAAAAAASLVAQTHPVEELIEAARAKSPALKDLLAKRVPNLKTQGAVFVWGQDFLFAAEADNGASASIDGQPATALARLADTSVWFRLVKMRTGVTHSQFTADGKPLGPRRDVAGYNPDSYPRAGVPKGTLSEKRTITSQIYDGATADYWIYASPGVDPSRPAPLMVWQDGQGLINGDLSSLRLFTVTENLVAAAHSADGPRHDLAGHRPQQALAPQRPVRHGVRPLRPLPDGGGAARGGEDVQTAPRRLFARDCRRIVGRICSLNVAWYFTDKFSRVHSTIGSYTSIQWRPDEHLDGGNIYPFRIRKEPKKNIRIWQSDGMEDIENQFGSWPAQAIQLANSLKMKGYDYHFRFGEAAHNSAQAALDLPESLAWLWPDYDPARTEQVYEQDPAEKDKPLYRFRIVNRDAW
jgi:enterochelin esterase family protein